MLNVVQPTSQSTVAVVGIGVVGLAALVSLKTLKEPPRKIIAVDIVPARLEMAKSFGATPLINSRESPEVKKTLMSLTEDEGVDGVIDTTGRPRDRQSSSP